MHSKILKIILLAAAFCVVFYTRTYQSYPPAAYTNAPSENNCTYSGCHTTYALQTSGTKWGKIKLIGNFTGNGYIPDSVYTLYLTYKESGISRFGFEMTCLDGSNQACGTFANLDSRSSTTSTTVSGKTRFYIYQTSTGSSAVSTDSTAWAIKWTAPKTNVGNVKFYVTLNSANNDYQESGDYIYAKSFTISPSSLIPTGKIKLVDSAACSGRTLNFKATVTGNPTSYDWKFTGGSPATSTSATPTVTYSSTGIFKAYLTVKNNKATGAKDSFTFTVYTPPSAALSPASAQTICKGDSVRLSANIGSGYSYKWNLTNQNVNAIYAKDSAQYWVTVTAPSRCATVSNKVMVHVLPPPALELGTLGGLDTVCPNSWITFKAQTKIGKADSWSFTSASGPFSTRDTLPVKVKNSAITATVWGKSASGCVSNGVTKSIQIRTLNTGPTLSIDQIKFTGFRVNWAVINGATGYKISTDSGKTWITPSSGNMGLYHDISNLLGNHSLKAMVYAMVPGPCGQTEISEIIGKTLACAPLDFSVIPGKTRACKNSTVPVIIHGIKNINAGITINGVSKGKDSLQNILITKTQTFDFGILDSSNLSCGYTYISIVIHEDTINNPKWDAPLNFINCTSQNNLTLQVNANPDATIDTFLFYKNNSLMQKSNSRFYNYNLVHKDSFYLQGKNENGCLSNRSAISKTQIIPIPNAGILFNNNHFIYSFSGKQKTGIHSWTLDTISRSGDSVTMDLTHYVNTKIQLIHTITNNGCIAKDTLEFIVPDFAKTPGFVLYNIRVFPNPSNGEISIVNKNNYSGLQFELYALTGQKIITQPLQPGVNNLYVNDLPDGTYLYKISSALGEQKDILVIKK